MLFCSGSWIISLLLGTLFPLAHGFIMCKCDTPECKAANVTECKADFYCYVSFRPAKPSEEKPSNSKTTYGTRSKLFIAEQRGCASHDQLDLCTNPRSNIISGGDFGDLIANEDSGSLLTVVRCCSDNYCEISQKLEFTPAELEGRQFFLNAEISDLEPGLDFPMFSPDSGEHDFPFRDSLKKQEDAAVATTVVEALQQKQQRKRPPYANDVLFTHQWFPGAPQPPSLSLTHDPPLPANFETHAKNRDALVKREEGSAPPVQLKQIRKEAGSVENRKEEIRVSTVFQPLHIAIGVCLIILMLVAVLLHVVVVLHRRHRRLKRQFLKQTQKTVSNDVHHQQAQQWPATTPAQFNVQQINLQHLKQSSAPAEHNQVLVSKRNKRSCCISCAWKRPQMKTPSANVYDEVVSHQTPDVTPVMVAPTPEMHFHHCQPHEVAHSSQTPVTYHSSLHSSVATPTTLPGTPSMNPQSPPPYSLMQPVMYSPNSPEHNAHLNLAKNAFGTGSSVSGGSGNNPSTTESSLPLHSSNTAGWNNTSNNPVFLLHNGLTLTMQHATNLERPSLSGSSEAGFLVTPDFETRRANVALPPALLGGDLSRPGASSPQVNTTSLALFRSAAPQNDTCPLVTPYAQLQLSLSVDQYDTPEQIFGDGTASARGSTSSDDFGGTRNNNQTSSNPTTNSSLLHSYCEHGGTGDFHI